MEIRYGNFWRRKPAFGTNIGYPSRKASSVLSGFRSCVVGAMFALLFLAGITKLQAQYTDGNIVIFRNTSGSAITGSTGTAITLDEYNTSTANQSSPVSSVALPFAASAGSNGIVAGGTTTSNGAISRSQNGRYILVPGWSTNSSLSGSASVGAANSTNIYCAIRPVNGSGIVGNGVTGTSNWFSAANDFRGATSDDGTNFWVSGATLGIRYTPDGTTLTTISTYNNGTGSVATNTSSTNTRAVQIINGQLYFSTGASTQGVYQVGVGKPTTAGSSSVNVATILVGATGAYGFALSPDFLTLYTNSATGVISRFTYNGSFSNGAYSGGSWSAASTGLTLSGATGVAVDWSGYSFSATASGNGAVIYACNATTLVKGNDNGTGAITPTTLATISASSSPFGVFKQIAFAPIKQSLVIGANTPTASNITKGNTQNVLFQFKITADEGKSTVKKVVLSNTGTASLSTDITNIKLVVDANGNGVAESTEISAATTKSATVSGSTITFSALSLGTYLTETSSYNFLVIGDVASGATTGNTFIPKISKSYTINGQDYTTDVVNAGGSYVYCTTGGVTGNTLTIIASGAPTPVITGAATAGSALTTTYGIASSSLNFAVSATNLTADITANAGTGFEVSADGTSFGSSATFTQTSGSIATNSKVYIRLSAFANASTTLYNNTTAATLSSAGATEALITTAASGNIVNPASLTITASDQSKIVGATIPTGSGSTLFSANGLVGTDAVGSVTIASTGAVSGAVAGTYSIVPSLAVLSTGSASNYNITYTNGTLTVASALTITPGGAAYTQNFDGIAAAATASLPAGWKVDNTENTAANFRTVSVSYANALSACTQLQPSAGASCQSSNGIWNCVSTTTSSDRCVGFISSSAASKNCNWYVQLQNASSTKTINSFNISYNIEKYRNQSNPTAFTVQLYYSTDGATWTSAGSNFLFTSTLDGNTNCPTGTTVGALPSASSTISGTFTPSSVVAANATVYFAWNYCVSSGSTTSNSPLLALDDVSITANTAPTITTQPNSSAAAYCQTGTATSLGVTATAGSGTITGYQWFSNVSNSNTGGSLISGATSSTYVPSTTSAGTLYYYCVVTNSFGLSTTTTVSGAITVTANLSPSVSIVANTGTTICSGSNVTMTATPTNGGTAAYQWFKGASLISGQTAATYTTSAIGNNDQYSVVLTPSGICVSPTTATSNVLQFTVSNSVTPTIAITQETSNPVCSGTTVIYNYTTTGTGTLSPTWYVNGSSAGTSASLTLTPTPGSYSIQAKLSSNAGGCEVADIQSSNFISLNVTAPNITPTVTIAPSIAQSICVGNPVNFTATLSNNGSALANWYVNNVLTTSGVNSFTLNNAAGSYTVQAKVTNAIGGCVVSAEQSSNSVSVQVNASVPPSVAISPSIAQTVCTGTPITFTASTSTGGTTPAYLWYKNGVSTGVTTASYTLSTPSNNDIVYVVLTPSAELCASPATAQSTAVSITVNSTFPILNLASNHVVHYNIVQNDTFKVILSTGTTAASYQWTKNGTNIAGATSATYTVSSSLLSHNDSINCVVTATNACSASALNGVKILKPTATAFTPGNIAVLRIAPGKFQNGKDTLWNRGSRVFIDEISKSTGAVVQSIPMNYAAYNPNSFTTNAQKYPFGGSHIFPREQDFSLLLSGVATSEGLMTLSSDGQSLVLGGYNAFEGSAAKATVSASADSGTIANSTYVTDGSNQNYYRSIGKVDYSGKSSVPLASAFLGGNNIRGVASDGTRIWAIGANGFYYFNSVADTSGFQYSAANLRSLRIFNGRLWGASASSPYIGLNYFGNISSLRDNGTLGLTNVTDTTGFKASLGYANSATPTLSPYGYVFNPTGDSLYIIDDDNNNWVNGSDLVGGGIFKYYYDNLSGKYKFLGRLPVTGIARSILGRSITADFSGSKPVLYLSTAGQSVTSGSFNLHKDSIVSLTDNGGVLPATLNWVSQAANYSNFRGVDLAPSVAQTPYVFYSLSPKFANAQYSGAFKSDFGTTISNTPAYNTGNNSFSLAGKFIGSGGVTVTPPAGFEISPSSSFSSVYTSTSPYTISQADMFDTSTRSIPVIYVRFKPVSGGSYSGNIVISASGAVSKSITVTGFCSTPVSYYYKGTNSGTAITTVSNWTTSANFVGGTAPSSMSASNVIWNFSGSQGTITLSSAWVLGSGSSIQVGGGSPSMKFIVGSTASLDFTTNGAIGIGAASNGILEWQLSAVPVITSLATGSTMIYSGSVGQTLAQTTYSNLTLNGGGAKTIVGSIAIDNVFTKATGTDVSAGTGSTVSFNGSGSAQSVPGFNYYNLTLSNPAGCIASGVDSVYGTTYIEEGTYTIPVGNTFFMVGASASLQMYSSSQQLVVNGNFRNASTLGTAFTSFNSGKLSFAAGSIYTHEINGGSLPTATWNATSTCSITGVTSTSPTFGTATFGNFTWNNVGQTSPVNFNTTIGAAGAFSVVSTGTSYLALVNSISSTVSPTYGSINVSGGTLYATYRTSTTTPVANISVGNITVSGTGIFDLANGASATAISVTYAATLTTTGDIRVSSGAKFYAGYTANSNIKGKVVFNKAGTQLFADSATVTNSADVDYQINAGTTVQLSNDFTFTSRTSSATSSPDILTNNGYLDINGKSLSINAIFGSGYIKGSSKSQLTITGSANNTLNFDQSILGTTNVLKYLVNTNAGTTTIGNALNIITAITPSNGTLVAGGNLTLKSTSITSSAVVDKVGSSASISGNVTVERFIPKGFRTWRDLAPQVYNAGTIFKNWQENGAATVGTGIFLPGGNVKDTAKNFYSPTSLFWDASGFDYSPAAIKSIYTFGASGWSALANTNATNLNPFQGYRIMIRGDRSFNLYTTPVHQNLPGQFLMMSDTKLRATGQLVYGDVKYDKNGVTNTSTGSTNVVANALNSATDSTYSLVANPYACTVDWTKLTKSNLSSNYWYLDPTQGISGVYIVYNTLTGSNNGGTKYIQPGQAFFVQNAIGTSPVNPSLTFTESAKDTTTGGRVALFGNGSSSRLSVSLWRDIDAVYKKMDGLAIVFDNSFSNGIGQEDATKINNSSDNIAVATSYGSNLSIDGRKPVAANDSISLTVSETSTTNYRIDIDASKYDFAGSNVYLKDAYLNKLTPVLSQVSSVTVAVDATKPESFRNRFQLVFKPAPLAVQRVSLVGSLENNVANLNWSVVNAEKVANYKVEKVNAEKRYVEIGTVKSDAGIDGRFAFSDKETFDGNNTYRIKAIAVDGSSSYSETLTLAKGSLQLFVNIYPNPVKGDNCNVRLNNIPAGSYQLVFTNGLGQQVLSKKIVVTGSSSSYPVQLNGLAAGNYRVSLCPLADVRKKLYTVQLSVAGK